MAARNKPYEQFGPFILFKKLETDALGDLWRAGKIVDGEIGPVQAVRRLSGGKRDALVAAAQHANQIVPQLNGTSFVRSQVIDVINGVPYVAHEYAGGRSLRHIVDRARGGTGVTPNPIPLDQAIVIAERVALSIATTADLRHAGERLTHGALLPQFVWISDDGEIRVGGQQLGRGITASLADSKVSSEIARYFPPEYQSSGTATKTTDIYSLGAIVFLLVTGQEPPDAANASAFAQAIGAAKTMSGTPIPDDIRGVLLKSLVQDPSSRYATIAEMKTDLSALAHGGKYSATTFNLAFYLSNLLKKEMEGEALDREKESKVNVAPYLEAPPAPAAAAPVASFAAHTSNIDLSPAAEPKRNKVALIAVAAGVLIAGSVGAVLMLNKKPSTQIAAATPALASTVPTAQATRPILPSPVVVSSSTSAETTTNAATGTLDEVAQKKAFEDAVKAQLEAEMLKLQSNYNRQLQQQNAKNAPVPATPAPVVAAAQPQEEERAPSAAQLDQQRLSNRQEPAVPAPAPASLPPAVATQTQPAAAQPAPAPAQEVRAVREGDVIDVTSLDVAPKVVRQVKPPYPPIAAKQNIQASIILTALVSETGDVIDVRVLRGDKRFGLEDAAVRALRSFRFTSPMKDGKRVKTWLPQTFQFKP